MVSSALPPVLLADFYLDSTDDQTEGEPQVEPEHVGLLYESLLSSESSRRRVRLSIEGSDPLDSGGFDAKHADGEFELLATSREGDTAVEPEVISFNVSVMEDSAISFRRYVGDVHLTIPCAVELGINAVEFKIGPSVHINASRIGLGSEALVVEKVPPKYEMYADAGVVLEAQEFEALSLNGSPTVYAEDFCVSWPGDEAFPWRQFRRDETPSDFDSDTVHKAYLKFRRIATAFQSRGKGALARSKYKIESVRIMQGELERRLLNKLVADGILNLGDDGKRYFWGADKANELLSVSWIDLRKGECPSKLKQYLSEFIQDNPDL